MVTKSITVPHANYKIKAVVNDKLAALENIKNMCLSFFPAFFPCDLLTKLPYAETVEQIEALLPWNISNSDQLA